MQFVNEVTPNVPIDTLLHAVVGPVIVPLGAVGSTNVNDVLNAFELQLFWVITKLVYVPAPNPLIVKLPADAVAVADCDDPFFV